MYPGIHAKERPNAAAAIAASSGAVVTWAELDNRSNQLAWLLYDAGLRRGDHIALFMENDLRYFEVAWAALRSGLYLTAVNRYLTTDEVAYILGDCQAQVLITSEFLAEAAAGLPGSVPTCRHFLMTGTPSSGFEDYEAAIAAKPTHPLAYEPAGSFMLYSSGTTGRPKGIKRPLEDGTVGERPAPIIALMQGLWQFDAETIYLSPAPLYHSAPLGFSIGTQSLGGTVVMMERFDAERALEYIERYHATHSQWVPTMFSRMQKLPTETRERYDLQSLRVAIHAAAPCPVPVKRQMIDWWGPIVSEYYAGTELNGFTHVGSQEWLQKPGTVGKALLGTIHICDENGLEVENGEPGIVYFEQEQMPFSYHNDPERTIEAQHPEHTNWSALGDVGYLDDDGYLFLTDRATFMIISGGVNIYPQEIEDCLIVHPDVVDVAVIGVPDAEMGEAVKAVVQLSDGVAETEQTAERLIAYARDHLAHFKCPRSIDFADSLPRLPTGKLYKRLLKDQYWGKEGSRIV
jgi:fatty-acyl-CoA synthase